MSDDKLDEFLDMMDEDPDWDSDDDTTEAAFARAEKSWAENNSKQVKEISKNRDFEKSLSFQDVFGSPIKRTSASQNSSVNKATCGSPKRKIMEPRRLMLTSSSSSFQSGSNQSGSKSNNVVGSFNLNEVRSLPLAPFPNRIGIKEMNANHVTDPYSKQRLLKNSVTLYCDDNSTVEATLKDRNIGLEYANLTSFTYWYKNQNGREQTKFWTSCIVIKKQTTLRKSVKGNDYVIWEVSDLKYLDRPWTVFLFGTACSSSQLMQVPIGSLIDLVTPSVMEDGTNLKFSVSNSNHIRHIGTCIDFAYCHAKRKDGKPCTAIVNLSECSVCIHHAAGELRKLNIKSKSEGHGNHTPGRNGVRKGSINGVMCNGNDLSKKSLTQPPRVRMALQGSSQALHRSSMRQGNAESISFPKEQSSFLTQFPVEKPKKLLDLCPLKTPHLSEKDRKIIEALGSSNKSLELAHQIAEKPNAGGRQLLRYLSNKDIQEEDSNESSNSSSMDAKSITMTREHLSNMKKALHYVKKNGPIKKKDPNGTNKKRKLDEKSAARTSQCPKSAKTEDGKGPGGAKKKFEVEFDFDSEEFKSIVNAKSSYSTLAEEIQKEEYFDKLERKEAIENKLLSTYTIPTNAVMCNKCKYIALSQSDFCKELRHHIRVVKATKRFFKCKDCGNRAMSLDRLPKRPCTNCKNSNWITTSVGKERSGPTLATEVLSVRGDEEKFIGSSSSKLYLHLTQ